MSKLFTAIGVGILPCLAGLMYPLFYRNDGKPFLLFAAFAAGALLAVGVQNLSYSVLYSWTDTEGETDMYFVAQHIMMMFALFSFFRFWMSNLYKNVVEKMTPHGMESEGLLQDMRENIIAPTMFDGSTDLLGACLIFFSLTYVPLLVGFSIGASPFSHTPTLVAYTLHRIVGAVSLSRSLDLQSTPSMYSWMSLASFCFAFPLGITCGSLFDSGHANGFLVAQCVLTASILIYDVLAEILPRILKSAEMTFTTSGDLYVYAAFSAGLVLFLVLATEPPSFIHGENAKHLDGGIMHRKSDPNHNNGRESNGHNTGDNGRAGDGNKNGGNKNTGNNGGNVNNNPQNNGGSNNNGNGNSYYPPNNNNNGGSNYPPNNNGGSNNGYYPPNNGGSNNNGYYPPNNNNNSGNDVNTRSLLNLFLRGRQ